MEGMLCRGLRNVQEMYITFQGSSITGEQWATGVIIKHPEITHGQWLYHCVQIHDRVRGTQITQQKKQLQMEIESQKDWGQDDLLEEDQYLAEVNLEDQENTSGKRKEYWLVAIQAAQEASGLQGLSQTNICRQGTALRGYLVRQLQPCQIRVMGFQQPIIPRQMVLKRVALLCSSTCNAVWHIALGMKTPAMVKNISVALNFPNFLSCFVLLLLV